MSIKEKYTILYSTKTKKIEKSKFRYPVLSDFLKNGKVIERDIFWINKPYLSHTKTTYKTPVCSLKEIILKKRILILK